MMQRRSERAARFRGIPAVRDRIVEVRAQLLVELAVHAVVAERIAKT